MSATAIPEAIRQMLQASAGAVSGFVYDPAVAADRAQALRAALPPWASLFFAVKANAFPAVLSSLAGPDGVDGFEVSSTAEAGAARAALAASGKPPRLAAAGPGKTSALLGALMDMGTEIFHAESGLELARLSALAEIRGRTVRVGLRVNPTAVGVRGTLVMGGRSSPFGVPEPDVPAVLRFARSLPGLDIVGFHMHAVCGNRDARAHVAYVASCMDWAVRTAVEHSVDLRWLDVGGGLGVAYDGGTPLDLVALGEGLDRLSPPAGVEVAFEPGRWLVADCGWYAAEVVDVKRSYGTTYVILRGGIGGFALPGTEDFPFRCSVLPIEDWPANLPRPEASNSAVTIAGELCTPEDVLIRDVTVGCVRSGDLVVIPQAGAYGWEFALQSFLGHPRATRKAVSSSASLARPPSSSNDRPVSLTFDRITTTDSGGVLARQAARESAARTYARTFRMVPVHAQGMTVTGADGRRYLDCLSGAGTLALGHNHPVVVEAVRRVIERGAPWHALDIGTPEKDEFTDALFAVLPPGLASRAKVHFCGPAGTDAVEAALKLVRTATGRSGVAAFTGAYHGMTAGALAASGGVTVKEPMFGVAAEACRLPYPYSYRCPFGTGDPTGQMSARYVERLLDDPNGGVVAPAAMILEAVQGEGGVVPAPLTWLREMRRITAERGIPLVVDEVQTGVGRTGTMWAIEAADVEPDVMVLSKAIGGSLPLAVVVYAEHLDTWAPGAHTGTFRGTTLAMAAGAATLRYVAAERLPERAEELGARLRADLRGLQQAHPSIGEVRGRGLMNGIELVEPDATPDDCGARPGAPALALAVRTECLRRGLIVELGGRHDAVVRLLPPLVMTDNEASQVLDRLDAALTAAEREYQA